MSLSGKTKNVHLNVRRTLKKNVAVFKFLKAQGVALRADGRAMLKEKRIPMFGTIAFFRGHLPTLAQTDLPFFFFRSFQE